MRRGPSGPEMLAPAQELLVPSLRRGADKVPRIVLGVYDWKG